MKKKRFILTNKETGKKESYNYIPVDTVTPEDIKKLFGKRKTYLSGYISTALSFDIETTSFYSKKYDTEVANMYIWQCGIDKNTIMGRTWESFIWLINTIASALKEKERVICWIQNFSFEWQFIKGLFAWNRTKTGEVDLFAKTERNILYARYKNIEFRDSMALTAMGLAKYKKNYNLDIGKLDGDLDYSLARHALTKLSNKELSYCINDVQTLNDWHVKYIVPVYLENEIKIPLTSTGIVRQEIKDEFNKLPKDEKKKIQTRIRNAQPSEQLYILFRNFLFRGGLTHANTIRCNYLIDEPFASLDLKSAHPSQMLFERFPWKFNRRNTWAFKGVLEEARTNEYSFFGIFTFHNIRCSGWHSLESKNKLIDFSEDATFDNGRLTFASTIKVALTEVDWFNYEDLYTWDSFECSTLYQAKKEPLPDYVRRVVLRYFTLKETAPDEFTRNLTKKKLNSCFGMAATSLPERSIIFDTDQNILLPGGKPKSYEDLTRYLIMLPQWAIWIAAYTRRCIVESIKACGIDSIYYDTDSNKISHYEKYAPWFEEFNARQRHKAETMEVYDFDRSLFLKLGGFEREYIGTKAKVLGAKRYLIEHDNKVQCTVAGMVKGTLEKYCKENDLDIWEQFTDDLILSPEYSEKQTTIYRDEPFTDVLIDYNGIPAVVTEKSCVAIINIPFTMNVQEEFLNRIEALREERERMIYKGVF